jgi:radical SAM family uncharacterized protein/radical SAM-linked protein
MQHLLSQKFFPYVNRPGRYTGSELGQIVKSPGDRFKVALGYPDMYEIGMSYLGIQILYNIINADDRFLCERFFAPDGDAEEILRREKIPHFSLESFRPLKEFDLIGFTLAYEMVYTNVLNILELSEVPLRSANRTDEHPLIIAGGPVAYNPEPMAPFFDLFFVGEVEESLIELLALLKETKNLPRFERLKKVVARIGSIYVPQFYDEASRKPLFDFAPEKIKGYKVKNLQKEFYPRRQIVPFIETVHDRLTIEIMRGCPRGCRFCQASTIYKPIRVRPIEDIVSQVQIQLAQTGYDEVSLLSLSSSDYPGIVPLATRLAQSLQQQQVALALPSLRPDTFTRQLAEAVRTTRKTGLTFAPEAGTERLRAFIRKDIADEQLYEAVRLVFENGWRLVKLYFMIGLPTETDDDIDGIVDMIRNVVRIGMEVKGRNIVNVTISPFSPKPHTPFQWDEQASPEVIRQKGDYIRRRAGHSLVNIKLRDPELPFLEGIIGRGGREMAGVVESAHKAGARFDGWTESFNFEIWRRAFAESGIDPVACLAGRSFSSELPWSHIETALSVEHLMRERERSASLIRESVYRSDRAEAPAQKSAEDNDGFGRSKKRFVQRSTIAPTKTRVRFRWSRRGLARFLSHLDNIRVFERAIRRSGLPVEFTQGFHPHIKISFGPPLQLGYTSEAEYFDLNLDRPFQPFMADKLNEALPEGFAITLAKPVIDKKTSLSGFLNRAVYEVDLDNGQELRTKIDSLLARKEVEIERAGKDETKIVDIRPAVYHLEIRASTEDRPDMVAVSMELGVGTAGYARPSEVILAAGIVDEATLPALAFHRKELLYISAAGDKFTPMDF